MSWSIAVSFSIFRWLYTFHEFVSKISNCIVKEAEKLTYFFLCEWLKIKVEKQNHCFCLASGFSTR